MDFPPPLVSTCGASLLPQGRAFKPAQLVGSGCESYFTDWLCDLEQMTSAFLSLRLLSTKGIKGPHLFHSTSGASVWEELSTMAIIMLDIYLLF